MPAAAAAVERGDERRRSCRAAPPSSVVGEVPAGNERGEQRADAGQHADHRRPDAELGGPPGGLGLVGRSIPSSAVRSPGIADDVLVARRP